MKNTAKPGSPNCAARSGSSVFRVLGKAPETLDDHAALQDFGFNCSETEQAVKMLASRSPASKRSLDTLLYYLLTQREAGLLDFEEGVLRHTIPEEFR